MDPPFPEAFLIVFKEDFFYDTTLGIKCTFMKKILPALIF
ncbi:hypothetical protein KNP414_03921 [Paenibacillus mucilaginosus KNP414]|uniref:Uncharacterized protein n=1 Tax=Paenibacillus mucilaginosus (strain KNP414) TaxID=1036673 RepID=F8F911_PAEMK|nr:hypothetical protein KNP414_03921 [Paenibacillus mucilaginosus KNP414]